MKTVVTVATILAGLASAAPAALSVCEVARAGEQLDGKTVRIRGVLREAFPGAKLFDELADEGCPEITIHVVTTDVSLPHPPPPGYKLDMRSAEHAQRVAEKALASGHHLSATILGVLYAQKPEDYVAAKPLNKKVTIPPHHKWYPFVLLIEAVPEIKEQ